MIDSNAKYFACGCSSGQCGVKVDIEGIMKEYDRLLGCGEIAAAGKFLEEKAMFADEQGVSLAAASCWNELCGFWRVHGEKEKCYTAAEKAIAVMRRVNLEMTVDCATMLLNLATSKSAFGELKEALALYGQVNEIYAQELDADDYRISALLNNIAQTYMRVGKFDIALESFERSMKILEKNKGDVEAEKATCFTNMAYCYLGRRDLDKAEEKAAAADKIFSMLGDDPHVDSLLACKGHINFMRGDYGRAADLFKQAACNAKRRFGKTAAYFASCRNCAKALDAAGKKEEAQEYLKLASSGR